MHYCGQRGFLLLSCSKMSTSALHPFPQLPHLSATFPGDQMLLDEDFQSRHCFVALAFINQKDQKTPLPIFSSPPSCSVPSRMTCGSAASKCFKSLRQRPLALETFGAETGGVVWRKHSREENSKNSERRMELSFAFRAVVLQFFHVTSKVRFSYDVFRAGQTKRAFFLWFQAG